MCTWSFSFLLLVVYNLGVQGQFCPKKFLTNIHKIYRLMLLICNFSTINNQWKQLNFIKILCAIFGLKLSPYPQFICFRNYKQKLYETVLMSSTCIFRKLQKKKKKKKKNQIVIKSSFYILLKLLDWADLFISNSAYSIFNWLIYGRV